MTKIKIELLANPGQLVAGLPLVGRVVVSVRRSLTVTHIRIMLSGRAFCQAVRTTRRGNVEITETAWVTVPLIDIGAMLFDPPGHRALLTAGEHNYDFSLPVDKWLPPSCELGTMANIRYTLCTVVQTDARVFADKKSKTAICCPGTFDPSFFDAVGRPLAPPVDVTGTKTFLFSRGGCEMTVVVPAAAVRGAVVPVRVRVINRSSKTIKSITIKLVQTAAAELGGLRNVRILRFGRTTMPDSRVDPLQTRDMTFEYVVPDKMLQSLSIAGALFIDPALHVQCDVAAAANLRLIVPLAVSAPRVQVALGGETVAAIARGAYTNVITGTGAVDAKELEFGNFADDGNEFDEDAASPGAQDVPVYPPQVSRIRGDTVLARTGKPDAWQAKDDVDDDDDEGSAENAK